MVVIMRHFHCVVLFKNSSILFGGEKGCLLHLLWINIKVGRIYLLFLFFFEKARIRFP